MTQTIEQDKNTFIADPTVEVAQTELNGQTLTLPVLSEGYFWRVARNSLGGNMIQIRKKFGLFSTKVDENYLLIFDGKGRTLNPTIEIEKKAAELVFSRLVRAEHSRIFNGLYGDFKRAS
jgi:hypothetical protein